MLRVTLAEKASDELLVTFESNRAFSISLSDQIECKLSNNNHNNKFQKRHPNVLTTAWEITIGSTDPFSGVSERRNERLFYST